LTYIIWYVKKISAVK